MTEARALTINVSSPLSDEQLAYVTQIAGDAYQAGIAEGKACLVADLTPLYAEFETTFKALQTRVVEQSEWISTLEAQANAKGSLSDGGQALDAQALAGTFAQALQDLGDSLARNLEVRDGLIADAIREAAAPKKVTRDRQGNIAGIEPA